MPTMRRSCFRSVLSARATLAPDRVRFAVRFDWLLNGWLVRPDIEKVFDFLAEALRRRFGMDQTST